VAKQHNIAGVHGGVKVIASWLGIQREKEKESNPQFPLDMPQ
jgi:hypothetical protein